MEPEKSLKEDWVLWLLLGTALLLLLGYWLVLPASEPEGDEASWLFGDTSPATLQAVRRYEGDRVVFVVQRDADGSGWIFSQPAGVEVDDASVERWVNSFLNLEVRRRFEASPDADYGFESTGTRYRVTVNGTEHDVFLGGEAPTGRARYVRYGSTRDAPVFLVANSGVQSLDKDVDDLREKDLFDRDGTDLAALTVSTVGDRVRYRSPGSGNWKVTDPEERTLNDTESEALDEGTRELLGLRASSFHDTGVPRAFEPVRARIEFTFNGATKTMEVGGLSGGERLVRVGNQPVVSVDRDPIDGIDDWPDVPEGLPEAATPASASGDTGPSFPERIQNRKQKDARPGSGEPAPPRAR